MGAWGGWPLEASRGWVGGYASLLWGKPPKPPGLAPLDFRARISLESLEWKYERSGYSIFTVKVPLVTILKELLRDPGVYYGSNVEIYMVAKASLRFDLWY